ncbi:MAG: heavy-metal-associated domain-containing protein [Persicimonas sp.]
MKDMLELFVPDLDTAEGARRIEAAVTDERGVQDADADLETQIVTVRYDDDQIGARSIAHAVEDLGYTVSHRPSERAPGAP